MTTYIANAFSLQMIQPSQAGQLRFENIEAPSQEVLAAAVSAVGHTDTAAVLGVTCARINVALQPGDTLYVAQLTGGRLPESNTTLPEGFRFEWFKVTL